jgi:hypothetical protein
MNRDVYIVLAYDHAQYRRKVREHREATDGTAAYVFGNSPRRLKGIEADDVLRCEGFWQRDDAVKIAQVANNRLK